jgi:uncharacterized ion transporter superfamily protein YfcC
MGLAQSRPPCCTFALLAALLTALLTASLPFGAGSHLTLEYFFFVSRYICIYIYVYMQEYKSSSTATDDATKSRSSRGSACTLTTSRTSGMTKRYLAVVKYLQASYISSFRPHTLVA